MCALTVNILKTFSIDRLIARHPALQLIKNKKIDPDAGYAWDLEGERIYSWHVIFLGKTGYGKSTTINKVIGEDLFSSSLIDSCTKKLYSVEYHIHETSPNYYFSIGDLPGIGESAHADEGYLEWYGAFIRKSAVIVYMLRADQRDLSLDLQLFDRFFTDPVVKKKVIIGVNFADKVEPLNRFAPFVLTPAQQDNLKVRIDSVSRMFDIPLSRISCFSSAENYNLQDLMAKICETLKASS